MSGREHAEGAAPRAVDFLTSLGHLLSAASLYPRNHPARSDALEQCWDDLQRLLDGDEAVFSFLDDVVLHGRQEMRDLRSWDLGSRCFESGIQRLEIARDIRREELDAFVNHVRSRLAGTDPEPLEAARRQFPNIRVGSLTMRVEPRSEEEEHSNSYEPVPLQEELEAVRLVYNEAGASNRLPTAEVSLAIESISITMDNLRRSGSGLLAIKSRDQYTAIHCMNVAILSMTFAERLGFRPDEIRLIGEAAMLHDIGKTKTPDEILNKPGVLTAEERKVIEEHTVEGCRLLLESGYGSRLAPVVAYEHHLGNGGLGYPSTTYEREPHPVSRLVQVCDVYDAIRTRRPFRPPMDAEESLLFLERRAGAFFHPSLVESFIEMVREMEHQTPRVQPEISSVERWERQAAAAAQPDESALLEKRLESMAESLRAPEPVAAVDWLQLI